MIRIETTAYAERGVFSVPKFMHWSWLRYIGMARLQGIRMRRTAELLLLYNLCMELGIEPPAIAVAENGKPDFVDSPYHIGISNSERFVAVALADAPVGLDMEPLRPHPAERIARIASIFSPAEQAALAAAPEGEPRLRRFLELWVRKEALCKLSGQGLAALKKASDTAPRPQIEEWVRDATNGGEEYYIDAYMGAGGAG